MHAKTHVQSQMKLQVILNYINYNKGEVENQIVSEPEVSASNTSPSPDTHDLSNHSCYRRARFQYFEAH